MANEFQGVTFAKQRITPSDDALIRRAVLKDGILTGCKISYSGSTLTMAAGHLMICGRQIRHPASQNWAVVDAKSGFARVVLTIDLTQTASKETFDQVSTELQYATAEDGFPTLEQSDINVSGSRYQAAVAVVSLGPGGITGIASQLELSRASGGVNFKVVGGLKRPADPKENMIWVETDIPVKKVSFQNREPASPSLGDLWISVGAGSRGAVQVTAERQTQTIYPAKAQQWDGKVWLTVPGKSFVNKEWTGWDYFLFDSGAIGYPFSAVSENPANLIEITGTDILMDVQKPADPTYIISDDKIDFSEIDEVELYVTSAENKNAFVVAASPAVKGDKIGYHEVVTNAAASLLVEKAGLHKLDVSQVKGTYSLIWGSVASSPNSMTTRYIRFIRSTR